MNPASPQPVIREAGPADIDIIRDLADRIWRQCYPGIITIEQIEYMLGWMYAAEKIRSEMTSGQAHYLLISPAEAAPPAGFAAHGPGEAPGDWLLHKLYIEPAHQRTGLGSALITAVLREAAQSGAKHLSLRVNRANAPAIDTYRRHGFVVMATDRADIGGGFVMDDYVMSRLIGPDTFLTKP